MADYAAKVRGWRAADLVGHQPLLIASKVSVRGAVGKTAVGAALGGMVGALVAQGMSRDQHTVNWVNEIGFAPEPQMVLGATTDQLLFWKLSLVTGRPTALLGGIPRSAVVGAVLELGTIARPLTIGLHTGALVPLDVPKIHARYAEALVVLLGEQSPPPPGPSVSPPPPPPPPIV